MTPIICDFTGKVIESKYDPSHTPHLGRDYFIAFNRIISEEGKDKLNQIVWNTMKAQGFGKYNFEVYKKTYEAAVKQFCTKGMQAAKVLHPGKSVV